MSKEIEVCITDDDSDIEARDHYREGLAEVLRMAAKTNLNVDHPVVQAALCYIGESDEYYVEEAQKLDGPTAKHPK